MRGVVLIPAAMGVKQQFYAPFVEFCEHGFAVLSFDYRGMGESLPPQFADSLRGFDADIDDWAELDITQPCHRKGLACGCSFAGDRPFTVASSLSSLPDNHLIDGLFNHRLGDRLLASQCTRQPSVWCGYCGIFSTTLHQYLRLLPGKKLRKVGNLPKGVIEQWTRWCGILVTSLMNMVRSMKNTSRSIYRADTQYEFYR